MIGGYLNKLEKYNITGPYYKTINIIRKTGYRDLNYFTRIKLIDPINAEILNILYSVYFFNNFIHPFIGIELSSPHTLSPLSKKLQIIYIRKDDRIITRDFII